MSPFSFDPCTFRWTQIQHGTGLDHLTPGRHFPYRNCSSETLCLIVHLSELHTCSRSMEGISLEITHSITTQVFLTESFWKLSPLDTQVWAHIPALVFPLLCSWWGKKEHVWLNHCSMEHIDLGQTNFHFSLLTFESADARIAVAFSEDFPFGPSQVSFLRLCLTCLQP